MLKSVRATANRLARSIVGTKIVVGYQHDRHVRDIFNDLLNNQGEISNCPRVRSYLVRHGQLEAIVSLRDFAFRKSGAQNKTSIVFFRKFSASEKIAFDRVWDAAYAKTLADANVTGETNEAVKLEAESKAIEHAYSTAPFNDLRVFLAEANHIGYGATGSPSPRNDLYAAAAGGKLALSQNGTILGEWQIFRENPAAYSGSDAPNCICLRIAEAWTAHASHRLDPKYHLFKRKESAYLPERWVRARVRDLMRRREGVIDPASMPELRFQVMTIGQSGEIRPREAGKGRNPPDWLGMYFDAGSSTWYQAHAGDLVYSSIDLWKGCIAIVPEEFDGAIVTKEFPIYEVIDDRIDAEFLSYLLRTRYYQRAFRAITTGHSNRRRTQTQDFEDLEICFPGSISEQQDICRKIRDARVSYRLAAQSIKDELSLLSDRVDGRHSEDLPEVDEGGDDNHDEK